MGDNGSGKTSRLEALVGRFSGNISRYLRTLPSFIGFGSQVFEGELDQTVWAYFSERSRLSQGYGCAWLQSYGLKPEDLTRAVSTLSQGEQVTLPVAGLSAADFRFWLWMSPNYTGIGQVSRRCRTD